MNNELRDNIAKTLMKYHWDGNGCGTHGVNACLYCFGPSPMSPYEIANVAIGEMEKFYENGRPHRRLQMFMNRCRRL